MLAKYLFQQQNPETDSDFVTEVHFSHYSTKHVIMVIHIKGANQMEKKASEGNTNFQIPQSKLGFLSWQVAYTR